MGQEYPGAQGSANLDTEQRRSGTGSLRLAGNFTKGGAYVGVNKKLADLDLGALSIWVRSEGVRRLTLRLIDSSGQCHQINRVPLADTSAWQEVALDIGPRIGEEHWGGANDGKWHAPATLISINIDKAGLAPALCPQLSLRRR